MILKAHANEGAGGGDRDAPVAPVHPAPGPWFLNTFPHYVEPRLLRETTDPGLGQREYRVSLNLVNAQHGGPNNKKDRTRLFSKHEPEGVLTYHIWNGK